MAGPIRPHRLALLMLTAIAASASCFRDARPPSVTPRATLAPGDESSGLIASQRPFGVVFGSPQGDVSDAAEVTIVFNRPMRPLSTAGAEAPAPVQMTPAVEGEWHWIGTNGLLFAPKTGLPHATRFEVVVPAGTRALDGTAISQPYKMTFTTPRPKFVETIPREGEDHLTPSSTFTLRFNQPVDTAEIARAMKLTAGEDKPADVAFDVVRPDPANAKLAELRPKKPLPLGAKILLVADAKLKGAEGPLPSDKQESKEYRTYGALSVGTLTCSKDTPRGNCAPHSSISFSLSNQVKLKDLKAAIRVTPAIKLDWWDTSDDYQTRYVHLNAPFAPARAYTVQIKGDLKDKYGQKLGKDVTLKAEFDDLWPTAEIGVTGEYFDAKAVRDIAIASVNVKTLELATVALSDADLERVAWPSASVGFETFASMRNAKVARTHPGAASNTTFKQLVRPADVLGGAGKRGPMAIAIRYTSRPGTPHAREVSDQRMVQITDLGISGKLSRFGSLVWVTKLSDGQPVAGAEVRVRKPGGTSAGDLLARTDVNGMATLPADAVQPTFNRKQAPIVIVRSGDDWAWRHTSELFYGYRYGVETDLSGALPTYGMAFTERGVYRPGDTARLKAIARTALARGTATPAGMKLKVRVSGPTGDPIFEQPVSLNEFGALSTAIPIPKTAPVGSYDVEITLDPPQDRGPIANSSFEVAEYRPAEFQVHVESSQPSFIRGDKALWTARGDYLFGAPMSKAKVHTTITRSASSYSIAGLEEWTTSDSTFGSDSDESSPHGGSIQSGDSQLDDKGTARTEAVLSLPGQTSAETVQCEAEVMDLSRQTVASSSTAIVHPGEFYAAVRLPKGELFSKAGDELAPELLAAEPTGQKRAGVKLDVELIQRTWVVAREDAGRGGYHSTSRKQDTTVAQCQVTTSEQPTSCKLTPSKGGYYILRAKGKDGRGNAVAASMGVYVLGEGASGWAESDDSRLELVADKKAYEVGQTARILVKSPFASADALVTVERSGVYQQHRFQMQGPMPTIQVPITDDLRPNAYVSVVLVRGRTKPPPGQWNAPDVGAPAFRVGYADLQINPESRRLSVEVKTNKKDYRPGEKIDVEVAVRDKTGKGTRTEVTLYAVDEGVLMLTGYKTPDPIPVMLAPRPLQVGFTESRADLARLTLSPIAGTVGADKGLEGGGGGSVRRNFQQSAYFNPSLVTDDGGNARASFTLPDSLTTYRVMAVVSAQDDRFGFGEQKVTTSRPLMARPAFPRILRAGDQLRAGVIVTSQGLPKSRFAVRLEATGIELLSDARQEIELSPGQSLEVPFVMRSPNVGQAMFRFVVEGAGERDQVEFPKKVQAPTWMESAALYGETRDASGEKLGDLKAMRPDVGGLELTVASTALVGLGGSMEELIEYPYLCTEQLTSRLVPLLPLRELARDFALELPKNADAIVANTIAEILKRQRGDGGFGMWPDSEVANPWATTYALWGLGTASRHGAAVPPAAIHSATEWVRKYLERWDREPVGPAVAAFIVDVLAENGEPDPGYANRLYDDRQKLPLFSRAMLLHALALGKGSPQAQAELVRDLEGHIRVEGNRAVIAENVGDDYAMLMDSSTRTNALVLRGVLATRPNHSLAPRLVKGLLDQRKGGKWATTQDSAYALLAINEFRKAQEKDPPDFVAKAWLGNQQVLDNAMTGRSAVATHASVPASKVFDANGTVLAFQMTGERKGTLYYEARLTYAKREMPQTPLDRGLFVSKTMRVVSPESLETAVRTVPAPGTRFPEPKGGELVLVDLVIVNAQPREYIVVDDPIPAGLEAINSRFLTTAASLNIPESGQEDDAVDRVVGREDEEEEEEVEDRIARGDGYHASWFRQEIRDDRVLYFVDHMLAGMFHYRYLARATTPGTFMMPPTKAEAMYQPEIFGRTAGAILKVNP
jgi:alpha-2-macroglobulin